MNKSIQFTVCHVTSVHSSGDARIFHKECVSLSRNGYKVFFVAPGESYQKKGVQVVGIGGKPKSRIKRLFKFSRKACSEALDIDADLYHLHDPELLLYVPLFKKKGKKIIFDSHEDYISVIESKRWIPKLFRKTICFFYEFYEKNICKIIDGVIVCYHWTEDRLARYSDNLKMILNYPLIDSPLGNSLLKDSNIIRERNICFAGGISSQWCHEEIIRSIKNLKGVRYKLAGQISCNYKKDLEKMENWESVDYLGKICFENVMSQVYEKSFVGMALLDYIPQCKGTVGNLSNTKLFEYMKYGLPVICTNFKLWKEIIDKEECGICVNPHDVEEISHAIRFLLDNPDKLKIMSENGKKAVQERYNWSSEESKLLELYENILIR